jgi:hypothetical protein
LSPFCGCETITGPPYFSEEKALIEEDEDEKGVWSPAEFKVS